MLNQNAWRTRDLVSLVAVLSRLLLAACQTGHHLVMVVEDESYTQPHRARARCRGLQGVLLRLCR